MTKQKRQIALNESETRKSYPPTTNDPQNKAFAGVGRPIKEVVWRVSILNFPNRSAENTAIMNAVYGKISMTGCMNAG